MTSTDLTPAAGVPVVAGKLLTPALFATKEAVDGVLQALEAECARFKETRDISTPAGREAIRSFAFKIARSKTALDGLGKDVVEDWKSKANAVDAERRRIRTRCDELKDEVRAPLTAWENKEKARVEEHEERLRDIGRLTLFGNMEVTSEIVSARIRELGTLLGCNWEEFAERASRDINVAAEVLDVRLKLCQREEAEAAELEQMRHEQAERERREREERIAAEAAARARQEAEEKAQREREELERQAREREEAAERARLAAEQKAEQERQAARTAQERIEQEKREAEERAAQAERDRIAAEERAAAERQAAAEREQHLRKEAEEREERARQEAAAQAKREQEEAERQAAIEAEAREQNTRIRARVNNAAAEAFVQRANVTAEVAKVIVTAIARGLIPNVSITY